MAAHRARRPARPDAVHTGTALPALVAEAGAVEVAPPPAMRTACEHVIARTVVMKGRYYRRCDICGETWPIEPRG